MHFEYILKHNIAYLIWKAKDSLRTTDGLKDTKPTLKILCRLPYLNIFVTILRICNYSDLSCNRFSSAKRKTHLNRRLTLTTLWRRDFRHQIFSRLCPRGDSHWSRSDSICETERNPWKQTHSVSPLEGGGYSSAYGLEFYIGSELKQKANGDWVMHTDWCPRGCTYIWALHCRRYDTQSIRMFVLSLCSLT